MGFKATLAFLLMALTASACNLPINPPPPTPTATDAGPTELEVQPTATPTEIPNDLAAAPGQVSGQVCYPSEFIPPMVLHFLEINTDELTSVEHNNGEQAYSVELPAGTYYAFAFRSDAELNGGGAYTDYIACGAEEGCGGQDLHAFDVPAAGQVSGIDICDWVIPAEDLPPVPEATQPAEDLAALPTATATAPPGGVSLNCDGTYQRVRIVDQGASGKTVAVDNWVGGAWVNVWNVASGDPNLRQLTDDAGHYPFGGCQRLVVVPFRHSNPQVTVELSIHHWNGAGLDQVYFNEGYYGEWSHAGAIVTFKEASKLGTINNGPLVACEWQTLEHEWDGSAFNQVGSNLQPVPNCTPTAP